MGHARRADREVLGIGFSDAALREAEAAEEAALEE
jgi:hypothetical protein